MDLPLKIKEKIQEILSSQSISNLNENFEELKDRYIGTKNGNDLVHNKKEVLAYLLSRMPATFAVNYEIISRLIKEYPEALNIKSVIDVGSGTGSATIACKELLNASKYTLIERNSFMQEIGKKLVDEANWIDSDIFNANFTEKADLVICSYMLNELNEADVLKIVSKLYEMTNNYLILVDPGTPDDYKRMMSIKAHLMDKGAKLLAPCKALKCGLTNDWCHFITRVQRSKEQKIVKNADVPYEDEKYTYLVFCKKSNDSFSNNEISNLAPNKNDANLINSKQDDKLFSDNKNVGNAEKENLNEETAVEEFGERIIRYPKVTSNFIELSVCTTDGIKIEKITKSDKEKFKEAKKASWGDIICK